MSEAHLFALGVVLAWLAGMRVYLTVFGVGLAGALGWMELPSALPVSASPDGWYCPWNSSLPPTSSRP